MVLQFTFVASRCQRGSERDVKDCLTSNYPSANILLYIAFFFFSFPTAKKKEKRFGEKDKNNCMYMSNIVNATLSVRLTYSGTFANVQLVNDPGCCPISVSLIL